MMNNANVHWQDYSVDRTMREAMVGHRGGILWFTGLSGAGKTTLARAVSSYLHGSGIREFVLDGDNVRHGLNADLGFSDAHRQENIRRIGEVSKLFVDSGAIVLAAFISPFRSDREKVRSLVGEGDFYEIYCECPLSVCENRDVKGLYKKARAGQIKDFTGISSPYEAPENPDVTVNTATHTLSECADKIVNFMIGKGLLPNLDVRKAI